MSRIPGLCLLLALSACAGLLHYPDPFPPRPAAPAPPAARAEHVLIVSIDGLRPDAIEAAGAETLQGLVRSGAYCPKAQTIRPSVTLPSHTSMLTGLSFNRHGVFWNNYRPGHIPHPTVFSVAADAGKASAILFSKDKFRYLADPAQVGTIIGSPTPKTVPKAEDYRNPAKLIQDEEGEKKPPDPKKPPKPPDPKTSAAALAGTFTQKWPEGRFSLTFIHIREPDEAGHRHGWMGREYLEAVRASDRALGTILDAIRRSGRFEKTAILVTADHGGSGRGHCTRNDFDRMENVTIPWICAGPGVAPGTVIDRVVPTYDTAPTALAFLGLALPPDIDGRPVEEVLR